MIVIPILIWMSGTLYCSFLLRKVLLEAHAQLDRKLVLTNEEHLIRGDTAFKASHFVAVLIVSSFFWFLILPILILDGDTYKLELAKSYRVAREKNLRSKTHEENEK